MSAFHITLGHLQRKYTLEDNYGVRTNQEIALMCGVHLRTIYRDIAKWKNSGEYDEFLDQKWHALLEGDTVDDRTKFLALTRLKEKRIRRQVTQEVEVNIKHDIDLSAFSEAERQEIRIISRKMLDTRTTSES